MNLLRGIRFKDWVLIGFVLLVMYLCCVSCRVERTYTVPPLVSAPNPDSLARLAQLPAYLVPPPAAATPRQRARWTAAQTQALANMNAPGGKVKLKNVGNPETTTTVQQGITGRQLTTASVIVVVIGLILWCKPWHRTSEEHE